MITTKDDLISFINNCSASELHFFCEFINEYQEKRNAESAFFNQMNIAEESIITEGTVTSAELRDLLEI